MHMLGKLENDQVNTLKKKWAGVPPYIMIFRSPPALFRANIVCVCGGGGGGGGETEVVGYLHYFELLKLAPKYNSRSDRQDSKDR